MPNNLITLTNADTDMPNNLITLTNADTDMPTDVHGNSSMRTVVRRVDAVSDSATAPFAQRIRNYSHQTFSGHIQHVNSYVMVIAFT